MQEFNLPWIILMPSVSVSDGRSIVDPSGIREFESLMGTAGVEMLDDD